MGFSLFAAGVNELLAQDKVKEGKRLTPGFDYGFCDELRVNLDGWIGKDGIEDELILHGTPLDCHLELW